MSIDPEDDMTDDEAADAFMAALEEMDRPVMPAITDEMVERAAFALEDECKPFFAQTSVAHLFDWRVAARNALTAALGETEAL